MKAKRKITLGEMQDECNKHTTRYAEGGSVTRCEECEPNIKMVCHSMKYEFDVGTKSPFRWDLTDPPRFTEAQMNMFRSAKAVGFKIAYRGVYGLYLDGSGTVVDDFGLKNGELLDLAELFGKEGEK